MQRSRDFKLEKISIFLIFIAAMIFNIYFGTQKAGFHEDEYYTYFSSNRTYGLYQPDREWQDRQTILDEFVVKEGEGFNYKLVSLVQSWDVHPPFYYMIFHTICSLVPGIFTKWTGIATNLIAFTISYVLLYLIMNRLRLQFYLKIAVMTFFGFNPQTISCNMLTRMYAFLTVFVFACALIHINMINDDFPAVKSFKELFLPYLLPLMIVSYLGFLTQYFYLFFFVSIGFAFTLWLVFWKKKIKTAVIYVSACALSLMAAVVSYPSSLRHMFGGYRGNEAAGGLFDIGSSLMRISFFVGLLNDFVFGGGLIVLLIAILIAGLIKYRQKQKKSRSVRPEIVILTIGTVGYFLLTAKAALLVGSASNRYEMPVYGLIILLVFMDVDYVFRDFDNVQMKVFFAIFFVVLLVKGIFVDNRVLFLYPEDAERIAYARDNKENVAVVMFNPATPHNVWRLTDELLEYPKVYYMNEENIETISDEELLEADRIVLYAADDDLRDQAIKNLADSTGLGGCSKVFEKEMWSTYEFNR